MSATDIPVDHEADPKPNIAQHAILLLAVCVIGLIGNTVATENTLLEGAAGLAVLYVISMIGLVLTNYVPFKLPSVAWISLVGIIATLPWTPGSP